MFNKKQGFTLIEMLVVVAIIGLLSSIVIVGLGPSRAKSRDAQRIAQVTQDANAIELAYDNAVGYPATPTLAVDKDSQGVSYGYCVDSTAPAQHASVSACLENTPVDTNHAASVVTGCAFSCTTGTAYYYNLSAGQ